MGGARVVVSKTLFFFGFRTELVEESDPLITSAAAGDFQIPESVLRAGVETAWSFVDNPTDIARTSLLKRTATEAPDAQPDSRKPRVGSECSSPNCSLCFQAMKKCDGPACDRECHGKCETEAQATRCGNQLFCQKQKL